MFPILANGNALISVSWTSRYTHFQFNVFVSLSWWSLILFFFVLLLSSFLPCSSYILYSQFHFSLRVIKLRRKCFFLLKFLKSTHCWHTNQVPFTNDQVLRVIKNDVLLIPLQTDKQSKHFFHITLLQSKEYLIVIIVFR